MIIMEDLNCSFCLRSKGKSHPVYVFGAGIGGKHGEDPCAATDIQDDFILEHMLVVVHGVPVGERPHLVLQHLLFKLEMKL